MGQARRPMKRDKPLQAPPLYVAALTGLAIALRVIRLDFQPLWWDEGYSVFFATRDFSTMLARTAVDIHPPLYYAVLQIWILFAGKSDIALRLLSVGIGVAIIPVALHRWANTVQPAYRNHLRVSARNFPFPGLLLSRSENVQPGGTSRARFNCAADFLVVTKSDVLKAGLYLETERRIRRSHCPGKRRSWIWSLRPVGRSLPLGVLRPRHRRCSLRRILFRVHAWG